MSFEPGKHMRNLKGQDYLDVKWRVVWVRDEHPDWCISTELLEATAQQAIFRATITDSNGKALSTAHGSETPKDFGDYIEKAETKAIGRALAFAGYGTQFAPDLDEGERIVDSPVQRTAAQPQQQYKPSAPAKTNGFSEVDLPKGGDLQEALNYIPFKTGLDAGKPMSKLSDGKLKWLMESEKTGAATKAKAKMVLDSRSKGSETPIPTDDDAPEELKNEEPPW